MQTITTEVYTLDELVQRGDERAVECALANECTFTADGKRFG